MHILCFRRTGIIEIILLLRHLFILIPWVVGCPTHNSILRILLALSMQNFIVIWSDGRLFLRVEIHRRLNLGKFLLLGWLQGFFGLDHWHKLGFVVLQLGRLLLRASCWASVLLLGIWSLHLTSFLLLSLLFLLELLLRQESRGIAGALRPHLVLQVQHLDVLGIVLRDVCNRLVALPDVPL